MWLLVAGLLYGTGMRLLEGLRLRERVGAVYLPDMICTYALNKGGKAVVSPLDNL